MDVSIETQIYMISFKKR